MASYLGGGMSSGEEKVQNCGTIAGSHSSSIAVTSKRHESE